MRLTRRGWAVLVVVVLAILMGAAFGPRGLNAIAAPGAVALAYGAVQVARFDAPVIDRKLPGSGTQGQPITVEVDVETNRPFSARFTEGVDEGLVVRDTDRRLALGDEPFEYELELRRRGDQRIGPARIEARDVLGLFSRTFEIEGNRSVLVRPPVYRLSGARADELVWIFGGGDDRQEFDYLRHYRRGDPLRDIHWRSSAKVPAEDWVVKEFSTDEGLATVEVAGRSDEGHADQMAAAVASIAVHLLAAGLEVGLAIPDARLQPRGGTNQRELVLDALARTSGGHLPERVRRGADLLVDAGPEGVTVELAGVATPFNEIAGRPITLPGHASMDDGAWTPRGGVA